MYELEKGWYGDFMNNSDIMLKALRSYKRDVKRLKACSPDWKPIPLSEYVNRYKKKGL